MLTWSDNASNETSLIVERSDLSSFSTSVRLAKLDANATTFTDGSVLPRTTDFYRVTAWNAVGSGVSASVTTQTPRR